MKNPKQIMSSVIITHGTKEVTIDGVEFWEKFYNEGKLALSELKAASEGKNPTAMFSSIHYTYGMQAIEIILEDYEKMMLDDARKYIEGVHKYGELEIDDYKITANSQYLTCIGVLMEGMTKMIEKNTFVNENINGLAAVTTVMLGTCNYFIEKEVNR